MALSILCWCQNFRQWRFLRIFSFLSELQHETLYVVKHTINYLLLNLPATLTFVGTIKKIDYFHKPFKVTENELDVTVLHFFVVGCWHGLQIRAMRQTTRLSLRVFGISRANSKSIEKWFWIGYKLLRKGLDTIPIRAESQSLDRTSLIITIAPMARIIFQ